MKEFISEQIFEFLHAIYGLLFLAFLVVIIYSMTYIIKFLRYKILGIPEGATEWYGYLVYQKPKRKYGIIKIKALFTDYSGAQDYVEKNKLEYGDELFVEKCILILKPIPKNKINKFNSK